MDNSRDKPHLAALPVGVEAKAEGSGVDNSRNGLAARFAEGETSNGSGVDNSRDKPHLAALPVDVEAIK